MITEQGIVKETRHLKAFITIERSSGCSSCNSKGACRSLSDKEMIVEAVNEMQAAPGDRVEISIPSGSFLKITFFVYFLPVLVLMAAALIGWAAAPHWQLDPTLTSVTAAVLALATCFIVLKAFDRKVATQIRYAPRITRILPAPESLLLADSK